ncbi:ANK-REP-REGION domain-containing protein [Mycena indigotica]|uniref:ANK-REP-REGION domain-containing protein n=1 Tax=Mycena indigotica TaxID=2126181 RepID=A0A8H6SEE3_9AGAR|nr:ANK-REP-REGION domain-containing protein [Mycena indigotica]KAF7297413.1 ANK-REP-REGION domain-containing protein [Mycena indigotica]
MRTPTQVVYVSGGRGGDGGPSYAGDAGHGGRGEGPRFEMRHNKISYGLILVFCFVYMLMTLLNSMYFNQEDQRKERKTILEWLSPINFLVRHQELSETRQRGTGEWILLHPVFLEWKSTPGKVLWCSGIRESFNAMSAKIRANIGTASAGAGKTVLASKIFDHLLTLQLKQDTIGLACIYLNYKDAETQTYKNLLAALWRQLVINQDMTPAQHLYSERHLKQGVTATLDDIGSLLVALVAQLSQVFIVLDALDEYSGDCDALVQQIQDLGANIHIIVMTRVHIVPPATLSILELEITAHQEDINTYVIAKLQDRRLKRFLNNNTALQVKILEQINQTADKM